MTAPDPPTPWVAPETPGDAPRVPTVAAPGDAPARGWSSSVSGDELARRPVPLRPMTAADVLDGAWTVLKLRGRTVLAVTAAVFLPLELVAALIQWGSPGRSDWATLYSNPEAFVGSLGLTGASGAVLARSFAASVVGWLAYALLGGALGPLITSWYLGVGRSASDVLRTMVRHLPALVGAFLLLLPLKVVAGAVCYVGSLFVVPLFVCTSPAIAVEGLGPVAGPRRSFDLVRRRLFPVMWIVILGVVVEMLVFASIAFLPLVLTAFVPEDARPLLGPLVATLGRFLTAPVVVSVAVLLYIDLRVRSEGLDLELAAAEIFGSEL